MGEYALVVYTPMYYHPRLKIMIYHVTQHVSSLINGTYHQDDSDSIDRRIIPVALTLLGFAIWIAGQGRFSRIAPKPPKLPYELQPDGTFVPKIVTSVADAQFFLRMRRSAPEFVMGFTNINDSIYSCDHAFTQRYHRVVRTFFSEAYLRSHRAMIRSEARLALDQEIAKEGPLDYARLLNGYFYHVFMHLFFGCRGDYQDFKQRFAQECGDFKHNEKIGQYLLTHLQPNKTPLEQLFNREKLTEYQQCQLMAFLLAIGLNLTGGGIESVIQHLYKHKDLRRYARQSPEALMRVIIEDLRLNSGEQQIKRGRIVIDLRQMAKDANLVGPDPETFNPNRFQKIPKELSACPWMPMGFGDNACPASRLYRVLATEFLSILLS